MADEPFDSWEEAAESQNFEKKLDQIERKQREKDTKTKTIPNVPSDTVIVEEDSRSTAFQPQIRILKRGAEQGGQRPIHSTVNPVQPQQKTLAEREAEYAAARARILGSDAETGPR
ncbi:uncharacterized protein TRIADDRAFT_57681 [Trichoplax adhaerens]|uniref:SUZ domain-containing protein n=1 Tax=Trichoplax adhaerens TaxID=10228 RepID=B3S046_TRIAD|nr:hypothetical protein TRIADDRAFT_57681 [Trichoplax adhaerens]EDV24326.1 hypothetical protein TRIADDRAFT_57681 [Trichoplax adhaerens]|eukprot:XP_002113852.1 hypothetical protein TRIADDRAFT_57681 [Trichoplax adhaerens]